MSKVAKNNFYLISFKSLHFLYIIIPTTPTAIISRTIVMLSPVCGNFVLAVVSSLPSKSLLELFEVCPDELPLF